MSDVIEQLREFLPQIDDSCEFEDWSIEGPDEDGWCTARIESDGESPGWVVECQGDCFFLTYEHGWYTQQGESERIEQLPILARAMESGGRAFSRALDTAEDW